MYIQKVRTIRFERCGLLLLLMLGLSASALADTTPSAAEIDWQPWEELPSSLQQSVPDYCGGTYRPPRLDDGESRDPDSDQADEPIDITSRSARYRLDDFLELEGDVRVRQGTLRARSDEAGYNQASGELDLRGGVVSRGEGFLLTGEQARADSRGDRLELNTATFLLHEAHMRGEATRIRRTGEESMRISQGVMTTCQPDRNDWSIAAGRVDLDQDSGFGTARHVRMRIKDVPVLYLPWISFPLDERRKTGFLYPSFGTSNAGSGFFAATPYYLNLAPHYDLTYTPQYIHGRGYFSEMEARYLSPLGQSDLQLGFIDSDNEYADDEPGNSSKRWGLDFTNQSDFGNNWRGTIDYAAISDDDYASDLNRTLDIQQSTHLRRQGELRYGDSGFNFSAALRGFQTIDPEIPEASRPYNQLPRLRLEAGEQWGNWYALKDSEYNYFWRDNEDLGGLDAAVGHRLRTTPEVGWELSGLPGFLRSSVMLDHTQYDLEDVQRDERFSRSVPFVEADAGLFFDRFFTLGGHFYNQTLEPRLYYVYSPEREQADIPLFDSSLTSFNFSQLFARDRFTGGDRVGDNNRLTAALTTRFYDMDRGIERARLSLGRIQRFDDENVALPNGRGRSSGDSSPLAGELRLQPLDNLSLRSSGQWDEQESETLRGTSQIRFHSSDFRYLANAGHTYDASTGLEQADVSTVFPVDEQTSLIGRWIYDVDNEETAGTLAGVEYTSCCWNLQLVAQRYLTRDEGLDTRILFQIQLRGLGGGGSAADTIRREIPGFEQRQPPHARPPMDELKRPADDGWP